MRLLPSLLYLFYIKACPQMHLIKLILDANLSSFELDLTMKYSECAEYHCSPGSRMGGTGELYLTIINIPDYGEKNNLERILTWFCVLNVE